MYLFCNKANLYGKELLAPYQTPKLEGSALSAVCDCFVNVFAAALHTGGLSSILNLRMCHAMVTGDPLIMTI